MKVRSNFAFLDNKAQLFQHFAKCQEVKARNLSIAGGPFGPRDYIRRPPPLEILPHNDTQWGRAQSRENFV